MRAGSAAAIFYLALVAAASGAGHGSPSEGIGNRQHPGLIYDCPTPPGLAAEKSRRMDAYLQKDMSSRATSGWYSTVPVPMSVDYDAALPVFLDLGDTPYLVGVMWAGEDYGDIVDRRMVCGHSIEVHDWSALIEAYGDGFATIDIRDAIADQALPQTEGHHAIVPHVFRFDMGGTAYRYVVSGVSVGITKVWRPDLVTLADKFGSPEEEPDSGNPDSVWPVLDRFNGVLLSAAPRREYRTSSAATVRNAAAIKPALVGRDMLMFDDTMTEQPVDLSGTPYYHGRSMGVDAASPGRSDPDELLSLVPDGETLLVTVRGGETVRADLSDWLDRQVAEIHTDGPLTLVSIAAPSIEFDYSGTRVRLVIGMLWARLADAKDGRAKYSVTRISGDVFAERPLY